MTKKHIVLGALALSITGCTAQLGDGEYHGHLQQEMRVTPEDVAADWMHEGDFLVSPALDAPEGATRVGVYLSRNEAGEMPRVEARALSNGGPTGGWVEVTETWGEEEAHVGIAELGTYADGAQLRIAAADSALLAHFRWNAVVPEIALEPTPADEADLGAASEALRSELGGLGIVTRAAWGARATRCTSTNSGKSRMAIHYTVTPSSNPERQVRGIQRYHMDSRGWCDVGYHFLVGTDGSIYEGRPLHLLGAHVGGHNTGNIGVSFIGCFNSTGCSSMGPTTPPTAMINAGGRLVGELGRLYGIALNRTNVKGHREHSGQSTSCPGDHLLPRIGDMLSIGRTGGAPPPPPPPPPSSGGSCTHSYGGTYASTACSAGYQCCDGRWRVRGSGCGGCLCVEETGRAGCTSAGGPPPAPTPPPGASCRHSYGGNYANTACSAGYQCCDGRWRVRGSSSACGACFCTESTGTSGCGT